MASITLPSSLVLAHRWSWRDVLVGVELELITLQTVLDAAASQLADADPSPGVVDLACCETNDPQVLPLLQHLAETDGSPGHGQDLWLYLVLRWVLENSQPADALQIVEQVYADFGYPEAVAPFVRYMPSQEPPLGSKQANEARLFEYWRRFIEREGARFRRER